MEKPEYDSFARQHEQDFRDMTAFSPVRITQFESAFLAAECYLKDLAWDKVPKDVWKDVFPALGKRPAGLMGTHNISKIARILSEYCDSFSLKPIYTTQLTDVFYNCRYPDSPYVITPTEDNRRKIGICLQNVREACEYVREVDKLNAKREHSEQMDADMELQER